MQCQEAGLTFQCESCGQRLSSPAGASGRKFHCPACAAVDFVPSRDDLALKGADHSGNGPVIEIFQNGGTGDEATGPRLSAPVTLLRPMRNVTKQSKPGKSRNRRPQPAPKPAVADESQMVLESNGYQNGKNDEGVNRPNGSEGDGKTAHAPSGLSAERSKGGESPAPGTILKSLVDLGFSVTRLEPEAIANEAPAVTKDDAAADSAQRATA